MELEATGHKTKNVGPLATVGAGVSLYNSCLLRPDLSLTLAAGGIHITLVISGLHSVKA
jgi:hypothetical protein